MEREPSQAEAPSPFSGLPVVSGWRARAEIALQGGPFARRLDRAVAWFTESPGAGLELGTAEVQESMRGARRPGVVAQLLRPSHAASLGVHIETTLCHALVDRLLGSKREPGEERLQVTPVEWGILTYMVARSLAAWVEAGGRPGRGAGLVLERVSAEPFVPEKGRRYATVRWAFRVGETTGIVRAWVPEAWLEEPGLRDVPDPDAGLVRASVARFGSLHSEWVGVAGTITLPRGRSRLRTGAVLPIDGSPLRGKAAAPEGPLELVLTVRGGRYMIPAACAAGAGGGRVDVQGRVLWRPLPREPLMMAGKKEPSSQFEPTSASPDLPVTLTVELGRISLPLQRLADLKPGDLLELGRHSREPVELTSNGRLVARGELVLIDTELGVRVTNVLL